ncbi:MAG: hypothetical protein Kow0069_00280 [Promethearchaeota archaeon]
MTCFDLSIMTTTGYPFRFFSLADEPKNVELRLLFFQFPEGAKGDEGCQSSVFELYAGLVSALYEFARLLERPIDYLQFKSLEHPLTDTAAVAPMSPMAFEVATLFTTRCDVYNLRSNVKAKTRLIYEKYVEKLVPLGPDSVLTLEEETRVREIMINQDAKRVVEVRSKELDQVVTGFLGDMQNYGLFGAVLAAFDMTPLRSWGLSVDQAEEVLRNLREVPDVEAFSWKYRQSWYGSGGQVTKVWVFIVNSGVGVTVEGQFQEYYYLLISHPGSFLGEIPAKFYEVVNEVLY